MEGEDFFGGGEGEDLFGQTGQVCRPPRTRRAGVFVSLLRSLSHGAHDMQDEGENVEVLPDEKMEGEGERAGEGRAVAPAERITTRYMTKYEKARILGTRALQLRCACVQRAPVCVSTQQTLTPFLAPAA